MYKYIINIILTTFEPLMVNLCSFVKVLDYFHMIMFLCFKLQIFKSTVILRYSHTSFLRVEGLGVQSPPNDPLADPQVEDLQNREYTRLPLSMFTTFGV